MALPFVTLTPSCFALETISARFLEETACAILERKSQPQKVEDMEKYDILGGKGAVVHEQELEVVGVVDEESLVAGRHQVAGLLVRAVANLVHMSIFRHLNKTSLH